eukprot:COSAG02_NODE_1663_length_11442_cov_757.870316_3_plen_39_part_00
MYALQLLHHVLSSMRHTVRAEGPKIRVTATEFAYCGCS